MCKSVVFVIFHQSAVVAIGWIDPQRQGDSLFTYRAQWQIASFTLYLQGRKGEVRGSEAGGNERVYGGKDGKRLGCDELAQEEIDEDGVRASLL